jgi:hypothetical protein
MIPFYFTKLARVAIMVAREATLVPIPSHWLIVEASRLGLAGHHNLAAGLYLGVVSHSCHGAVHVDDDGAALFGAASDHRILHRVSGRFSSRAKKSRTIIIYMNGTVARVAHNAKVQPGCEIVVPSKPKRDASTISQWLGIGTSVASLATMIATLANLVK